MFRRALPRIFSHFARKQMIDNFAKKADYIFYKIVGAVNQTGVYTLQCINTKAIFYAKINDIISDLDILYGLHPVQACYIGLEVAKSLKREKLPIALNNKQNLFDNQLVHRYGQFVLCHQNRKGDLYFVNQTTNEQFTMAPQLIAFTKELIQEFDASQAFYIGLLAGLKIDDFYKNTEKIDKNYKYARLTLVKK